VLATDELEGCEIGELRVFRGDRSPALLRCWRGYSAIARTFRTPPEQQWLGAVGELLLVVRGGSVECTDHDS